MDISSLLNQDISEALGIQKWEVATLDRSLKEFPRFLPKTDQERIQNLVPDLASWTAAGASWEVTEKLDGTSMTVFVCGEEEGVCSRNYSIIPEACGEETSGHWSVARRDDLIGKLRSCGRNLALQGELVGPRLQENPYNLTRKEFYCFDILAMEDTATVYLEPSARRQLCTDLGINHVPIIAEER